MLYGEKWTEGEDGVMKLEKGIFLCVEEFVTYRRLGWEGVPALNAAADRMIAEEDNAAALERGENQSGE